MSGGERGEGHRREAETSVEPYGCSINPTREQGPVELIQHQPGFSREPTAYRHKENYVKKLLPVTVAGPGPGGADKSVMCRAGYQAGISDPISILQS